jgi:type II secretory pathway predicted ATPase ExeA
MGGSMQCFSIEELEQLDEDQLAFLRRAMERELSNNPEILRILRQRVQPIYDRMASQRRPQRTRSRRRTLPPTDPSASD